MWMLSIIPSWLRLQTLTTWPQRTTDHSAIAFHGDYPLPSKSTRGNMFLWFVVTSNLQISSTQLLGSNLFKLHSAHVPSVTNSLPWWSQTSDFDSWQPKQSHWTPGRFLQLFLLPSHGNMPRSFIDTLVQSQSKVVKESRSGTRVSWLNRLPEISHNHVKNYPKSKETAIGRAHCSLPWLWRKSMFLQDSDFANLMLVLMVRMMQNLSEVGFRFVWLFPFCPC